MKKITTLLTAAILLVATSAFAMEGEKATPVVKEGFKKDFIAASSANWKKVSDFYFVDFTISGKNITAAYNEDGELLGTSQNVNAQQLPVAVTAAIAEKYGNYKLSDAATEVNFEGTTNYYVVVENGKQSLELKCNAEGDISVEKRTKK
jgi:hypothetical protein